MPSHVAEEVMHARCAGIDVSKRDAKVTIRIYSQPGKRATLYHLEVGSTASQIAKLRQRLINEGVTCVVFEATSNYWKPFYYGLEGAGFELILVNPKHVKSLKGRKTDRKDANFLSRIGALGMCRASFVPDDQVRALRTYTRERTRLVHDRTGHINHLEKILEDTCLKLTSVSSETLNVSTRAILDAICAGETDPVVLAKLGARLKASPEVLREALTGRVEPWHVETIRSSLRVIDLLSVEIERVEELIVQHVEPFKTQAELLCTIPGVSTLLAAGMLGEMGPDMSAFPTSKCLASWAGVAPGANQSAGVNRPAKCLKGNKYLKRCLGAAVNGALNRKDKSTFFCARYRRLIRRGGKKMARVAVMRSMVTAIWHMLSTGQPYKEQDGAGPEQRDREQMIAWHKKRLAALQAA